MLTEFLKICYRPKWLHIYYSIIHIIYECLHSVVVFRFDPGKRHTEHLKSIHSGFLAPCCYVTTSFFTSKLYKHCRIMTKWKMFAQNSWLWILMYIFSSILWSTSGNNYSLKSFWNAVQLEDRSSPQFKVSLNIAAFIFPLTVTSFRSCRWKHPHIMMLPPPPALM